MELPDIRRDDDLSGIVQKLAPYFLNVIQVPKTFTALKTQDTNKHKLSVLSDHLLQNCDNRLVVHALLALSGQFAAFDSEDESLLNESRAYACEVVAWRIANDLTWSGCLYYLLYELPHAPKRSLQDEESRDPDPEVTPNGNTPRRTGGERTPLLQRTTSFQPQVQSNPSSSWVPTLNTLFDDVSDTDAEVEQQFTYFGGLNALELAAVAGAKNFLSQRVVQKLIDAIWCGDIVFWESLSVDAVKEARIYDKSKTDLYSRLRVPRYMKMFEIVFFASFLALYYIVLVQKQFDRFTEAEILLYLWIASFAYNEFGEYQDAGSAFYAVDFWSVWDIGIIVCGVAFLLTRVIGLARHNSRVIDTSFDILALEALFLVPRICSLLSLNPYFGTLMPCLKEMTKDFVKFLSLVLILYLGFLTTFTLLARGHFGLSEMSWILIKVFFGSSYLGFDIAQEISPILGPPVMTIFVILTNILLITSLISLLSNSLTKVIERSRDEYLFVYSVYVLEASTSNKLTYYFPPWNLIRLALVPLRAVVPPARLRKYRIVLLKYTHFFPYVASIWVYETFRQHLASGTSKKASRILTIAQQANMQDLRKRNVAHDARRRGATLPELEGRVDRRSDPLPPDDDNAPQEDLRSLVLKLSFRIEQLAAAVAEQNPSHVAAAARHG